jgi:heme O synthase-like polyprenyltransferase
LIALLSALSVVLSFIPAALGLFGPVYLYTAVVLGLGLFSLSLWLMFRPTGSRAIVVFKVSSLYLGLLFLAVLIGSLL